MKEGFYLSPNGLHIVELKIISLSRVCDSFDVAYIDQHKEIRNLCCDGEFIWMRRFLECWEYLE